MTIAVDFDGTIVRDRYPEIGSEIPFATQTLKMLQSEHHRIILWTVREGRELEKAIEWCRRHGLEFYAVNKDYEEETHATSRKLKADLFIDDRQVGGLPAWSTIYKMVHEKKTLRQVLEEERQETKRPWWKF